MSREKLMPCIRKTASLSDSGCWQTLCQAS
jgi:hypothetical protein